VLGNESPCDVGVGDDASKTPLVAYYKGSSSSFAGKHLGYREDTIIDGRNQWLLWSELGHLATSFGHTMIDFLSSIG